MTVTAFDPATIPGPPAMPLLGRRGNYLRYFRDPIGSMRAYYATYGSVVAFIHGSPEWVFAFGPEYNHQILTNPDVFHASLLSLPAPSDSSLRRLTVGLLSMNGEIHRQQRRLILPAFHRHAVANYYVMMQHLTQKMLDQWSTHQSINITDSLRQLTMQIVLATLFGIESDRDTYALARQLGTWLRLFTADAVHQLPIALPGLPYRHLLDVSARLETALHQIIAEKRANLEQHQDMLATLIQARDEDGTSMTDMELIGQANLLFIAGHETSTNALTWTLFLLAQHPSIHADLVDELTSVLQGDPPTIEQMAQLPLLDSVVKESLRLLPPASAFGRFCTTTVRLGPYTLPKGSYVTISPYITHQQPDLYPEPKRFLPDRWARIDPSPYEYLPFSAGPRMCLGSTFAMLEIKLVIAMLLQRYRLTLAPNARIDRQLRLTLSPKHGMPMLVTPQDRQFTRSNVRGNIRDMIDFA